MNYDMVEPEIRRLAELIYEVKVAMLTTTVAGDRLRTRPMYTQDARFDGTLWFLSSIDSPVVGELRANGAVLLTYAHPWKHTYISLNGTAEVLNDRARIAALWKQAFRVWFPVGDQDPDIRLIHVFLEHAEFWDSPSAPVRIFQFAKAMATGETMPAGEHVTAGLERPA